MIDINVELIQWFLIFFNLQSSSSFVTRADKSAIRSAVMSNQQLAEELHKPIIRKF